MPERTWESVAERLGISPDDGWPDVLHALLDRIDGESETETKPAPKRKSRGKQEPAES